MFTDELQHQDIKWQSEDIIVLWVKVQTMKQLGHSFYTSGLLCSPEDQWCHLGTATQVECLLQAKQMKMFTFNIYFY